VDLVAFFAADKAAQTVSKLLVLRTCSTTKTGWSDDPDGSLPLAERYAEQAIEKNPNEPLG
jgi:hypothetical protein